MYKNKTLIPPNTKKTNQIRKGSQNFYNKIKNNKDESKTHKRNLIQITIRKTK